MRLRIIHLLAALMVALAAFAQANYQVTSATRLNVRKAPTVDAEVLGTFESGEKITVLSIDDGWAKVKFGKKKGYVVKQYIAPLAGSSASKPKKADKADDDGEGDDGGNSDIVAVDDTPKAEAAHPSESPAKKEVKPERPSEPSSAQTVEPRQTAFSTNKMSLYFALQGGAGWSKFKWSGDINGTLSYSGDLAAQLYFNDQVAFIPRNWYCELALGYDSRGAADFAMSYVHARIMPLGYRISSLAYIFDEPINVTVKAGPALAYPLSKIEAGPNSWSGNFQFGVVGGFQIEWQRWAVGAVVEYDFSEVSSDCGEKLNNMVVLGTISYKFASIEF